MEISKTEYKKRINKVTEATEYSFNAMLLSMSDNTIENKETKKLFKIATLKFHLPNGKLVTRSAMCYENSYSRGLPIEQEYLTTLSWKPDGGTALLMSHLPASSQSTAEDFADLQNDTPASIAEKPAKGKKKKKKTVE